MKKALLVLTVLAIGFGGFGFVDTAYAAQETPVSPGNGRGDGMGGNGSQGANGDGTGVPVEQNIHNGDGIPDGTCDGDCIPNGTCDGDCIPVNQQIQLNLQIRQKLGSGICQVS